MNVSAWPVWLATLVLAVCLATPAWGQTTGDTESQRVELSSDSLSRSTEEGVPVQRLFGNVRLRQGTTRIRATRATRYRQRGETLFTGNVLIVDEGDSLWADRVRYDSREKVGRATGDVRVADGEVLLAGPAGRYFFNEKHAVFPERVTLVDSARVLKSLSGEYFSREKRAEFYRQVRVFSDSTYLEADSVTYRRNTEVSEARGQVFIERRGDRAEREEAAPPAAGAQRDTVQLGVGQRDTLQRRARRPSLLSRELPVDTTRRALLPDTTARALLWGNYAYNDPQAGYSRVTGRALLVRLEPPEEDTAAARSPAAGRPDTLIVRARQLETTRSDTLRRLIATDSVHLWQQDLQAVADSSVYDRRPPQRGAQGRAAQQRQETRLFGTPISWSPSGSGDSGGGEAEGAASQLSGDSLRVTGRGGDVRRLYARGNAFLAQEDSALAGRLQQLKGRRMTGYFTRDANGETTLRRLEAGPNGEAIYFTKAEDGTLQGATRASSDSIYFQLEDGALRKAGWLHGVEGLRYEAEDVPNPFELDGLVWVPERRPRKNVFLREERVRRRLVRPAPALAPVRRDPASERPPPARAAGPPPAGD